LRFLQLGKWRQAALTVSGFIILVAAGIFLLNYTSGGGYLWQHWTHAQRLTYSWRKTLFEFWGILKTPVFFSGLCFLFIFIFRRRRFPFKASTEGFFYVLRSPELLILFYFTLSFGWAVISSGRVGANMNYYIEGSLMLAVMCGCVYAYFKRNFLQKFALAMIVLFTLGGAFQLARILRGEYSRWQAVGYYREVLEKTRQSIPAQGATCVTVAAELAVWSGCGFHFDDYSEYEHGWSPELREIFEKEVKSNRYAAIIWDDDKLQERFPNYRMVPMSQSAPEKFFPVYLYVPAGERAGR
jgi:hypothetical protein